MGSIHKVGINVLLVDYSGRLQKVSTSLTGVGDMGWYRGQH